ncbi:hypothetical protein ACEWY4_019474 [Coilia grayii]|uniref:Uncharacterized protein n=1 Tax=Coilia grayii TaxID=363190 RepID=A0ABD1JB39_9TELE
MYIITFTFQGSKERSLNAPYSLRRRVVPSRHFNDFYLGSQPLLKEAPQTVGKLSRRSGKGSTPSIFQGLLPVPISSRDTLTCADSSSALPQCAPGSPLKGKTGCERNSDSSGATLPPVTETAEYVGQKRKRAKTSHCLAKPKDVKVMPCPKPPELGTTPQAPKVSPSQQQITGKRHLEERLEMAALLLQMAQQVPKLIPEAGCNINLQQELRRIKEYGAKIKLDTSAKKAGNPVKVHSSSGKQGHVRTLESDPKWTAPRDREAMSFPNLEDSSLMAEVKERRRREVSLQKRLRHLAQPVEEDFIENAAVLPDLRPLPPVAAPLPQSCSVHSGAQSAGLLMHGHAQKKYRALYRSVVDWMRKSKPANGHPYNIALGRSIKQALWEKLSRPSFEEKVDGDGRVTFIETFSSPTPNSCAPNIDVDYSDEPLPEEPIKKRARR